MRVVMFYQSLVSDWNHGNAHFLRGVASELLARGHEVSIFEPADSWCVENLIAEHGEVPLQDFAKAYPQLKSTRYDLKSLDLNEALDHADLVLVHEWNEPDLIERIGDYRRSARSLRLFFHDTHHRLATMRQLPFSLEDYDGVLAYGKVIADRYVARGWAERTWVWHEAADVRVFHPLPQIERVEDLVWIGNWGDEERTLELREFLLEPVKALHLKANAYGVRYPAKAKAELKSAGITFQGWLPNYKVPEVFARSRVTLHIPRRPYVDRLPGIPTIRPFEALACGIPLICSPWADTEELFSPGEDFLVARNGKEMRRCLKSVLQDEDLSQELALHGLSTVLERHTCAHRVDQLLTNYQSLAVNEDELVATA